MPVKRIIILNRAREDTPSFACLLWADVPLNQRKHHVNPTAMSVYRDVTAQELAAIRDGSVVERAMTISMEPGSTMAEIKSHLEEAWQAYQDEITGDKTSEHYGTTWDGTNWVVGG